MSTLTHSVSKVDTADEIALAFGGRVIPGRHGWVVTIQKASGTGRLVVSKVDGDDRWIVDGDWGRSPMPRFWNGAMSRCTLLVPASPQVSETCEAAIR